MGDGAIAGTRLTSTVTPEGTLEIGLQAAQFAAPGPGEVLVEMAAAPVNPSDLGLLLGPVEIATLRRTATGVSGELPATSLTALKGRVGKALPVGFEGAGRVVAAAQGRRRCPGGSSRSISAPPTRPTPSCAPTT